MSSEIRDNVLTAPINRTLSEHIAERLREAILNKQLEPGERIVERDLAEAMQTSRGPVRDALKILENEGLVVRSAHRGTIVAQLNNLADVEEIYSVREALELLGMKYTIKNASNEQIDELAGIVDRMAGVARRNYTQDEATDLDLSFHRALMRMSGHKRAIALWEELSSQTRLLLLTHRLKHPLDLREVGVLSHRRVVEALRDRNCQRALDELHLHLRASYEGIVGNLKNSDAVG
jgi:DNA-binding GntR family transcriptional regulator